MWLNSQGLACIEAADSDNSPFCSLSHPWNQVLQRGDDSWRCHDWIDGEVRHCGCKEASKQTLRSIYGNVWWAAWYVHLIYHKCSCCLEYMPNITPLFHVRGIEDLIHLFKVEPSWGHEQPLNTPEYESPTRYANWIFVHVLLLSCLHYCIGNKQTVTGIMSATIYTLYISRVCHLGEQGPYKTRFSYKTKRQSSIGFHMFQGCGAYHAHPSLESLYGIRLPPAIMVLSCT